MPKLIAEFTAHHPGFACTAYLMAEGETLAIHCMTRGSILYSKSTPKPTTYRTALADLKSWAQSAPLL